MNTDHSRYLRAIRKTTGHPSALARLSRGVAAGAILVLPVACGTGDQEAFATATSTSETTFATTAASDSPPTTVPTTSTTAAPTSEPTTSSSGVFPTDGELLVSFNYEPSESNRAKRPYIAVWVEDADGNLVDTISLWFDQGAKGTKWLDDLSQWYRASGGEDTTMSGATRIAGGYTVAWDGTDQNGDPVAIGEYVLNIESAREHGPTSFTSGSITVGDTEAILALDDDGELSAASASLRV